MFTITDVQQSYANTWVEVEAPEGFDRENVYLMDDVLGNYGGVSAASDWWVERDTLYTFRYENHR